MYQSYRKESSTSTTERLRDEAIPELGRRYSDGVGFDGVGGSDMLLPQHQPQPTRQFTRRKCQLQLRWWLCRCLIIMEVLI